MLKVENKHEASESVNSFFTTLCSSVVGSIRSLAMVTFSMNQVVVKKEQHGLGLE